MNKKNQPVAQPPTKSQPVQAKTQQPAGKQPTKAVEKK